VVVWRKEFRPDSGGAGTWRGGLGQVLEFATLDERPFDVLAMFDRVYHPARGRALGGEGGAGFIGLASGPTLRPKGQQTFPAGDRLRLELPGGGGYGDPFERDPARVADDVRSGLVSLTSARTLYGVALDGDGAIDEAGTASLRRPRDAVTTYAFTDQRRAIAATARRWRAAPCGFSAAPRWYPPMRR